MIITRVTLSIDRAQWSDELLVSLLKFAKREGLHVGEPWTVDTSPKAAAALKSTGELPMQRRRRELAERHAAVAALTAEHGYRELLLMKRKQEKIEWSGEKTRLLRVAVQQHPGVKEYKISLLDRHYSGETIKAVAADEGVTHSHVAYVLGQARRYLTSPKRRDHPVRKKHADKFHHYDEVYEYRVERAQQMRDTVESKLTPLHSTEELDAFQSMPDFPLKRGGGR